MKAKLGKTAKEIIRSGFGNKLVKDVIDYDKEQPIKGDGYTHKTIRIGNKLFRIRRLFGI